MVGITRIVLVIMVCALMRAEGFIPVHNSTLRDYNLYPRRCLSTTYDVMLLLKIHLQFGWRQRRKFAHVQLKCEIAEKGLGIHTHTHEAFSESLSQLFWLKQPLWSGLNPSALASLSLGHTAATKAFYFFFLANQ